MPLDIVGAGHQALRTPTRPVTPGPDTDALIRDMLETLRDAPGVGLESARADRPARAAGALGVPTEHPNDPSPPPRPGRQTAIASR